MTLRHTKPVKDLVEMLVGRGVTIGYAGGPFDLTAPHTTGVYVDRGNRMTALALVDLPLTAYLGAALGLVPAAGVRDGLAEGQVAPALQENTAEVLNVLAAMLGEEIGTHQRLDGIYAPGEPRPVPVQVLSGSVDVCLDLTLEVQGYGAGALSLVVARNHGDPHGT